MTLFSNYQKNTIKILLALLCLSCWYWQQYIYESFCTIIIIIFFVWMVSALSCHFCHEVNDNNIKTGASIFVHVIVSGTMYKNFCSQDTSLIVLLFKGSPVTTIILDWPIMNNICLFILVVFNYNAIQTNQHCSLKLLCYIAYMRITKQENNKSANDRTSYLSVHLTYLFIVHNCKWCLLHGYQHNISLNCLPDAYLLITCGVKLVTVADFIFIYFS